MAVAVCVCVRGAGLEKKKGGVRVTFVAGQRAIAQLGTYVLREQLLVRQEGRVYAEWDGALTWR